MVKNRFKTESDKKPKKKSKRALGKKEGKSVSLDKINERLDSPKNRQVFGLALILFSVYLLIAFVSYLFTWKIDQSKVELPLVEFLFDSDVTVENWLGKLGAITSHLFIYKWFGIASFAFVYLFFLFGFKVLFKISLLPLKKSLKVSFFILLWSSVFFAFFFSERLYYLGGAFGYEVDKYLQGIFGTMGMGLLIFFALTVFLIVSFNAGEYLKQAFSFLRSLGDKEDEDSPFDQSEDFDQKSDISTPLRQAQDDALDVTDQKSESEEEESSFDEAMDDEEKEVEEGSEGETQDEEEEVMGGEAVELSTETKKQDEDGNEEGEIGLEIEETTDKETVLSEEEVDSKVAEYGEYDPTLDLSNYKKPGLDLLTDHGDGEIKVNKEELEANKDRIVNTLENYNIKIQTIKATIGPTVTLYEIVPAPGVRISKIKNLEDDIALSLAALGIRIIAPIPGKGTIGIEVPNQNPDVVSMKTVIASEKFQNAKFDLPVVLGKTISNETYAFDLAKMPHLLMAGATGQGKSVGLNAILTSLLYKKHPAQLKFVLVDPKKVELTLFNKIERHFLAKLPDSEEAIITDNQKVINTLNSLCIEMDDRYELLKSAFVRNIKEYNAKFIARKLNPENGHKYLPYIVLVIDEFADLIMTAGKEVEQPIARLAQLARAIGIHLIIATQRPSTNIITGSIKANFPARIAFRVTSGIDSRTILDSGGAEQLIGRGDMLLSTGNDLIRLQCAFVDTPEVEELTEFIGSQRGYPEAFKLPEYVGEDGVAAGEVDLADRDALFEDAARVIVQHQQGSASLLQRRLKLGYNRAGRIIDQLEAAGIIGPFEGSKARQVLIADETSLEQLLKDVDNNN
jgi:S-DNA-T family DNA segregation ATPase FtsK/SpoIIIE